MTDRKKAEELLMIILTIETPQRERDHHVLQQLFAS
jgi:hypothetical protein